MRSMENRLARAVRTALALALVASGRSPAGWASDRPDPGEAERVTVTGSRIPAVERQSAVPLVIIDRAEILATGKTTLGDVLQNLPAVNGKFTNPRVNTGGGTGAATVSLHGLGTARTLLLVNGQRMLSNDVNTIPVNAVERIEVLTEGASTIYGSDAIAGVANVILRNNFQGAEFAADYGISDRGDGVRRAYRFTFGQTTDRGNIVAGVDYSRQDAISSSSRRFSQNALYYYYGVSQAAYSSSTPTGLIGLPANLKTRFGCTSVTLKQLGSAGTSLDDYRCYTTADGFNYQANGPVVVTPQERTNAFVAGNYRFEESVEAYVQYFHDKTRSASSKAPQFIDTLGSALVISKDNYYNPFGVEFSNAGYRFKTRAIGNGYRIARYDTATDHVTAGFDGHFGASIWQWNAWFDYSHVSQLAHTSGYLDAARIDAQLGPSYRGASGQVVCGTPASGPIPNCTPVDIFAITDPATVAALASASIDTFTNSVSLERSAGIDAEGALLSLPAGDVHLAAGVSHRHDSVTRIPDASQLPDSAGFCDVGSGCVPALNGAFDISEAYVEANVPLLRDATLARTLNLTIGERHTKSNAFGSTTNARLALDWRPLDDLLLGASVGDVSRVPTIADLFAEPMPEYASAVDPCYHLMGSNAACATVPGDGSFIPFPEPPNIPLGLASGSRAAGIELRPERGRSFDWRIRYRPSQDILLAADFWHTVVRDTIGRISAQTALDACFVANGGPFCPLIHRFTTGPLRGYIQQVQEPIGNLGNIEASGVDLDAQYRIDTGRFGKVSLNLRAAYLDRFAVDPTPGLPRDFAREYAGHYTTGTSLIPNANFSRWKALAVLNWNRGSWNAGWTLRYVGRYTVGHADLRYYNESACGYPPGCELNFGASVRHNVMAGYDIEPLNARIEAGIDNLTDRQPPLVYQSNSPDNNVDATTFDTVGRFYWTRISVRF